MGNILKLIVLIVNLSVCFSNNDVLNQQVPKFKDISHCILTFPLFPQKNNG